MAYLFEHWAGLSAATLSFVWCAVHLFVGGRQVARPLRDHADLDHTVMATMWMCWHMVTASLFLMGTFFVMGLVVDRTYMGAGTLLAAAIAVAGLMAPFALKTTFKVLPQGWLFVPVAALGAYAAWA